MDASSQHTLVGLNFLGNYSNEGRCNSNGPLLLWNKALEAQTRRRSLKGRKQKALFTVIKKGHVRSKRSRRILMKKRTRLEGSRRSQNVIEKRISTLRKLVPNSESVGLDGLFRDITDCILSLQMRVKVMQIMVKVLSGCDD
ncbi:Transcription factor UPBEAT1 [Camellia lanceoleosa]|uniref:Transcription factor UPBEAT1 n=1 Tax=Camellia lanceoleosa TaxID=1840588 RepID=A0ACC0F188_9ERIC|nr:Transcription factor UPBEAT1 [Camellia lanceoleosa]